MTVLEQFILSLHKEISRTVDMKDLFETHPNNREVVMESAYSVILSHEALMHLHILKLDVEANKK